MQSLCISDYHMRVDIKSFRSIKDQSVELFPITLLYGPNGSGKSSLIYSLLTLKNIILNSNQQSPGFFNYGFASLGNYVSVVHDHKSKGEIQIGLTINKNDYWVSYDCTLQENKISFRIKVTEGEKIIFSRNIDTSLPYPANQPSQSNIQLKNFTGTVNWNGITSNITYNPPTPENKETADNLLELLNLPVETIRKFSVIPIRRGFTQATYTPVAQTPMSLSEQEVATQLTIDKYLASRVSFYLEKILNRDFRVNATIGTAIFSLDTTDRATGVPSEVVNDGFGVNQLVYFLTKTLQDNSEWIFAEEPEVHLHPSAIRKFAIQLINIAKQEDKKFVISTHSEAFLVALLGEVAAGNIDPSILGCYYVSKEGKVTTYKLQKVNANGQIEGGLSSFMEDELQDIKKFFKLKESPRDNSNLHSI